MQINGTTTGANQQNGSENQEQKQAQGQGEQNGSENQEQPNTEEISAPEKVEDVVLNKVPQRIVEESGLGPQPTTALKPEETEKLTGKTHATILRKSDGKKLTYPVATVTNILKNYPGKFEIVE